MSGAPYPILLVDDDPNVGKLLRSLLTPDRYRLVVRRTLQQAEQSWDEPWSAIVIDSVLPDGDSLQLLQSRPAACPVLVVASSDVARVTIDAMKAGAFDCLQKPLDLGVFLERIQTACRFTENNPVEMGASATEMPIPTFLVGQHTRMLEVYKSIGRLARTGDAVLIYGEIGTGKESVARAIHEHGESRTGDFRVVYCPSIPAGQLEAEIERSADGIAAHGGALLLQEVGEIDPACQSYLLGRLRRGVFGDVGQNAVRLIATSTVNLARRVQDGSFRADLYYILSAQSIELPPLRERLDDLPDLVARLLTELSPNGGASITEEAMELLRSHNWPGNIDELIAVLRRCLSLGNGAIVADDTLQESIDRTAPAAVDPTGDRAACVTDWAALMEEHLAEGGDDLYAVATLELDRQLLRLLMKRTGGNQSEASRILGITRASLRKRLRLAGLQPKRFIESARANAQLARG